jgi:hypothetical protein
MSETVVEKIESTVDKTEKKYELRPLAASDLGMVCKIISEIGVRQFKECFNVDQIKEGMEEDGEAKDTKLESIGFGVVFDIAGIVISNIPEAEADIQKFIASLTGLNVMQVKALPLADYGEIILDVVTNEDFKDFFKRVMKLFNR